MNLGQQGIDLAHDGRRGMLRGGDDAHRRRSLRSGSVRYHLQAEPSPVGLYDCRRDAY